MKNKNGKALDEEQLNTVAGGGGTDPLLDECVQRIEAETKRLGLKPLELKEHFDSPYFEIPE